MTRLVAALALLASSAFDTRLDVAVTPGELTIGDRAELTLSLRLADGLPTGAVSWPEWGAALGSAEILEIGPVETLTLEGGQRLLTQTLGVTFFEIGEGIIPSIALEVATANGSQSLTSEEVRYSVRSILPEGEAEPQAKPPAPPQRLGLGERFWWATSALLATCLAALALLVQQSRERESEAGALPRLSPRQELERALESLRTESNSDSLHAGISMTTRRYLGRTLDFPAPESTTSEIQRLCRQRQLEPDLVNRTGRLLTSCDMVKFARRHVDLARGQERLAEVESIADGVDEWLRPPEPNDSRLEEAP